MSQSLFIKVSNVTKVIKGVEMSSGLVEELL